MLFLLTFENDLYLLVSVSVVLVDKLNETKKCSLDT